MKNREELQRIAKNDALRRIARCAYCDEWRIMLATNCGLGEGKGRDKG